MQGKRYLVPVFVLLFLIGVPGSGYSGLSGNELVENMLEYEKYLCKRSRGVQSHA